MRATWGPRERRRPRDWARLATGALVAVISLALGGCSAVRNDLGTGSSSCYVAIAAATGAVHHHGRLHGVRLEPVAALRLRSPRLYHQARLDGQLNVCLVAFTGHYAASTVDRALGQPTGDLAVVEVGYPDRRVLGTLLVTRQPLEFGHSHIFPL